MEVEKDALIKKLVAEGKNKADARRELISHGFSTEGFETMYDALVKETPIPVVQPKIQLPPGMIVGDFESFHSNSSENKSSSQKSSFPLLYIVIIVVGIGLLYVFLTYYKNFTQSENPDADTTSLNENLNLGEKIMKTKVETTAASAAFFESRMGGFSEVCREIVVLDPIVCLETEQSYVVFAPVSDSSYYCIDAKGFNGTVENRPVSGEKCQ